MEVYQHQIGKRVVGYAYVKHSVGLIRSHRRHISVGLKQKLVMELFIQIKYLEIEIKNAKHFLNEHFKTKL